MMAKVRWKSKPDNCTGLEKTTDARVDEAKQPHFVLLKGFSPILASSFLVLVFAVAVGIVVSIGLPAVDMATATSRFDDALITVKLIDNAIREVVFEGAGAKRLVKFASPGDFEAIPQEDSVQFKMQGPAVLEYLSRRITGNIVQIAGSDVSCSDAGNLTIENSYLRVDLKNVAPATPAASINTNDTILAIKEKSGGTTVAFVNSTVVIDGNPATASGTGYSEILKKGRDLPSCTAHVFVNSTADYDIYYTLYAGADFLVMDVRNVR